MNPLNLKHRLRIVFSELKNMDSLKNKNPTIKTLAKLVYSYSHNDCHQNLSFGKWEPSDLDSVVLTNKLREDKDRKKHIKSSN